MSSTSLSQTLASGDRGDVYSLDALMTLYELEPTLRDVYVEGRADLGLLQWLFLEENIHGAVFAVDDRVEVPSDVVKDLGQDTHSARGRAVALAIIAHRHLGPDQLCVTVVVDADFAHIVGPVPVDRSCLFMTDDTTVECYVLEPRPLNKLLRTCLHVADSVTAEDVRSAVMPALGDVLATRIVMHEMGVGAVRDVAGVCRLLPNESAADIRELLRRSLTKVPRAEWPSGLDELVEWALAYRDLVASSGQSGRGHDVAPLLIAYLGIKGPLANVEALEAAMRACLDPEDLRDRPLFKQLRARLTA